MQLQTLSRSISLTAVVAGLALLGGCNKAAAPGDAAPGEAAEKSRGEGVSVSLQAEERSKLGVTTVNPKATTWVAESSGVASVVSHDGIAQAVAELATAQAADRQSHAAVERATQLADSAGALSAEAREGVERQAGLDAAALELAQRRLSTTIGEYPPWQHDGANTTLNALASGRAKLIRATFPLGSVVESKPASVRVTRVGDPPGEHGWDARNPWQAPADPTVPGRSYFAVLNGTNLSEGERLIAWVPTARQLTGWLLPESAVVQADGKYWCYIEVADNQFRRIEVDTQRPRADGYFVSDGVDGSAHVVTAGASLLLARELNPSTSAE